MKEGVRERTLEGTCRTLAGGVFNGEARTPPCNYYLSNSMSGVAGEQSSQGGFSSTASKGSHGGATAAVAASLLAIVGVSLYASPIEASAASPSQSKVDFAKVKLMLSDMIEKDAEARGNGQSIAGTLVRLAWHASGMAQSIQNFVVFSHSLTRCTQVLTQHTNEMVGAMVHI